MIALLVACAPLQAEPDGVFTAEGLFVVARVLPAGPLPRPPALDAPTPTDPAALGALSEARVRVRARSDPAELERVLSWKDADVELFSRVLPALDVHVCHRLRARTAGDIDFAWFLANCAAPEDERLFTGPDVSAEAAVRWSYAMGRHGAPPDVGLARATELVAELGADDDVRTLFGQLCETDRPDLAAALRATLDVSPDVEQRLRLAASCPHQTDPELAAAWAQACGDGSCDDRPDVLIDLDAAIEHPRIWVPSLIGRHPAHRGAILDAVERCALDVDHPFAAHCLASLADAMPARARRTAAIRAPSADPAIAGLQVALERFPEVDDLREHLRDLRLIGPTPVAARPELEASALGTLGTHGRVVQLDGDDPDAFAITAELIARATGALPGVRFEPVPPPDTPYGRGMLRAWDGDRRWQVVLSPASSGRAIAGLLNALLIQRGSELRVAEAQSTPGAFLWGPGASLRSLHDDRLLPLVELQDDGADAL